MTTTTSILISSAFAKVVNSIVNGIMIPIISLCAGGIHLDTLELVFRNFLYKDEPDVHVKYGLVVESLIYLLAAGTMLFLLSRVVHMFVVILPQEIDKAKTIAAKAVLTSNKELVVNGRK